MTGVRPVLPARLVRRAATALVAVGLTSVLTGCADDEDPFATYCDEVRDQQKQLTEQMATEDPSALIEALPSFRALAGKAPDDIQDEWTVVVDRLEGLEQALDDAGVEPQDYDRDRPPAGVTQDEKAAIDAASRRLTTPESVAALQGVQQQARDVCKTPLSLA